jgi:hypothetical protein
MTRLALTDQQIAQLQACAARLRTADDRERFVCDVVRTLARRGRAVTNADITAAINRTIGIVSMYLTDAVSTQEEANMRAFNLNNEDDDRVMRERARRGEPILRDGESMRVSMMDSRSNQRASIEADKVSTFRAARRLGLPAFVADGAMADSKPGRVTDGGGNAAFSRPGFRIAQQDAAALDARRAAHQEYLDYIESAYRIGDSDRGDVVSNRVKVDAAMTMDQIYSAYDESVSRQWAVGKGNPVVRDALPAGQGHVTKDARAQAYQEYQAELSQAWRSPPSE